MIGSNRSAPPSRVIQAYFPGGRTPTRLVTHSYPSQTSDGIRSPHLATLQMKDLARGGRSPHAATLPTASAWGSSGPATAQKKGAIQPSSEENKVHAFQTPDGFLDAAAGRTAREMPPTVKHKMETFFDSDFSDVRVHVGPEASSIGAIAFTLGTDIYFAPGQYDPHTTRGQELLGHELTHVVQQRDGRVANPFNSGVAVVQDTSLEDEADRMGALVAAQRKVQGAQYRKALAAGGGAQPKMKAKMARSRGRAHAAQSKAGGGYSLVVGAYMHEAGDKDLPEPLAGHAFVAVEGPTGEREAWGFSPDHYGSYDPRADLGKLRSGVDGVVHDDAGAFEKRGVKTRSYPIDEVQAKAARAKVAEYEAGKYRYQLGDRSCSAFVLDVADAANIDDLDGVRGKLPRDVYKKL